jgi:hypothetical protein
MNRNSSLSLILLGFVALFALLLGSYAGGYVALSRAFPVTVTTLWDPAPDRSGDMSRQVLIRRFSARWLAIVFQPAAWIESRIRREEVELEPSGEPEMVL